MISKEKALLVAELAKVKKAEDIIILDMRKLSNIADFFIIASASSTKRAQTITDNIEKGLLKKKERVSGVEGYQEAKWILVDAFDVVAHIFYSEMRTFYDLENLWGDAPRIRLCRKKRKKTSRETLRQK